MTTINADGQRRLKILADFMDQCPQEKIRMDTWFEGDCGIINDGILDHAKISCDTAACAAGWACSIPALNKEGLKWKVSASGVYNNGAAVPEYKGITSWMALEEFFNIDEQAAEELFDTLYYGEKYEFEEIWDDVTDDLKPLPITGTMVADNIRRILNEASSS